MNTSTSLVQSSWQQVLPIRELAAELFYAKLFELDPALAPVALNDVPKIINGAETYQGEKYLALMPIPPNSGRFGYQLKEVGFEDCFASAAKQDWTGADLAARNLQNKYLQAWARLAAAKSILQMQ